MLRASVRVNRGIPSFSVGGQSVQCFRAAVAVELRQAQHERVGDRIELRPGRNHVVRITTNANGSSSAEGRITESART